jgi:hypothetical protein
MSAIGYARRSVMSDPIAAQAISILGRAQLYAGQASAARKTFEVAGQLGWRDAMTQIYWLDQAMQVDDFKVAAERLDALLRQTPGDENRDRFLALVSATPEGRAAVAARLAASPTWAGVYVTELKDIPREQLEQRVDVMLRSGRGVWSCADTAPITQKMIDADMLDEAQSVWRLNCATSPSLVFDGGFEQLDTTKSTSGFDWHLSGRGDVNVQPTVDATGGRRLDLEVVAARVLPVLSQLIVLAPGKYRLTWRTPGTAPNLAGALSITLNCNANFADAVAGIPDSAANGAYALTFDIDDACRARQLIFWLSPKSPIHLDDVALQRI